MILLRTLFVLVFGSIYKVRTQLGGGIRDFNGFFLRTYARGSENCDFTAHVLYGCVSFVKSMFVFDVMVWMENLA